MSILDAHPTPRPGAYWPPGFRERANQEARELAERDRQRAQCSCRCHQSSDRTAISKEPHEPR